MPRKNAESSDEENNRKERRKSNPYPEKAHQIACHANLEGKVFLFCMLCAVLCYPDRCLFYCCCFLFYVILTVVFFIVVVLFV